MSSIDWRPRADHAVLAARADVYRRIRSFFEEREVLEVETPLLDTATVTDVNLESLEVSDPTGTLYLQTSPEYAMKRLLAAGCGPIYQICKAFRAGEAGSLHNPEFTLLEWYRPGFDHHELMGEVETLVRGLLTLSGAGRLSYREAMLRHAGLDPFESGEGMLRTLVRDLDVDDARGRLSREDCLDLILSHKVQPALPPGATFIYDFPAAQAALARIRPDEPAVAERFELFVDGVEIANGYHELIDPAEQRCRFERDVDIRRRRGLGIPPLDERLLCALEEGMPDCAGVALGLDRLLMLLTGAAAVSQVIAFPAATR